ncbi:MAG TPA: DUF1360 domain-containing protein [Pilimelia sp.]|nr:DUF1360 domain-containing protein [Pilimelia sp.]
MTDQAEHTETAAPAPSRPDRPDGRLRRRLNGLRRAYAPQERRPLGGYLLTLMAYGGAVAGLAAAGRLTGRRLPERPDVTDVVLISLATHKLSRLLAKDSVTSPLRAPFTRYQEPTGHSEVNEEVRAERGTPAHAVGELVSCPYCLAMWVSTGFTGGLVLAPRLTRLVATAFTAVAVSDFLQAGYAMVNAAADDESR